LVNLLIRFWRGRVRIGCGWVHRQNVIKFIHSLLVPLRGKMPVNINRNLYAVVTKLIPDISE
jgi:hypothetical protein